MHILITDFGSAKILPNDSANQSQAEAAGTNENPAPGGGRRNSFVGTPQYVSPEILTNSGSSAASDLWALGCIIYQMVTGIPPFHHDSSEYLIFQKVGKHLEIFYVYTMKPFFKKIKHTWHNLINSCFRFKAWTTVSMTDLIPRLKTSLRSSWWLIQVIGWVLQTTLGIRASRTIPSLTMLILITYTRAVLLRSSHLSVNKMILTQFGANIQICNQVITQIQIFHKNHHILKNLI